MGNNMWIIILALAFAGCAAALLVAIAKWQEEKERRFDEISRAVGLENEIEQLRRLCEAKDYAKQRMYEVNSCLRSDKATLQDKLSALLCPRNDHVWEVSDAYRGECRCKKCGRAKE